MGLDQADRGRVDPAGLVGATDGQRLALDARRQQAGAAAVAGLAHAAQHRVDAVAVGQRIVQPLEHDHAQALAEQGAVAAGLEGPHLAARAERAELGEDGRHVGRQRGIDAAGEHQPAAAGAQFVDRRGHRQQRRRAGRVDQVVRSAKIEPVGDAAGHHVGHQAGRGVGIASAAACAGISARTRRQAPLRPGCGIAARSSSMRLVDARCCSGSP